MMEQQIKEIIEKNLPKQVGETLQKRLAEADKNEKLLEIANQSLLTGKKAMEDADAAIDSLKTQLDKHKNLDKREKEITDKETAFEIEKLKYQLESEKDKTSFSKEVALGLVRNTQYRRDVFDNVSEPGGTDQYGNRLYVNKTQNLTETRTEE